MSKNGKEFNLHTLAQRFRSILGGKKDERIFAWRLFGHSVQGYSHKLNNKMCQDAILWYMNSQNGYPFIMAVADGHGDEKSFRSRYGAKIAVNIAIETINQFVFDLSLEPNTLSSIKRIAKDRLPKEIVLKWQEEVFNAIERRPLNKSEIDKIEGKGIFNEKNDALIAYGTTLTAIAIHQLKIDNQMEKFILFLRLGDGDIMAVSENGAVTDPLDIEPRIGEATFSMSMDKAWHFMDFGFVVYNRELPRLVILSTDGYRKSFQNSEDFQKVGSDILNIIQTDGVQVVEASLEDWLAETSKQGSGDDITLGICINILPED